MHHAIINVCHEVFDRQLISTTFATRKGMGQYAALDAVKQSKVMAGKWVEPREPWRQLEQQREKLPGIEP